MVFLLVLMIGVVCAANGWGDINTGEEGTDSASSSVGVDDDVVSQDDPESYDGRGSLLDFDDDGGVYTSEFYIALGVAGGGVLLALLFIYLFIRGSKNKWKKK